MQRNQDTGFSRVAVDQSIEQTVNRHTKTSGGIIGFSLCSGAVQCWLITAHEHAAITHCCQEMAGLKSGSELTLHKELQSTRLQRDKQDVRSVMEMIESWVDPFNESTDCLVNLSSGIRASVDIESDMLNAHSKGSDALQQFVEDRLKTGKTSFHDPLPAMRLKTFCDTAGKKNVTCQGRNVVLWADRNLFARLTVLAQNHQMDMREVLKRSLGPLPWVLAAADGSLAKTSKAKLLHLMEGSAPSSDTMPLFSSTSAAWLYDGLALLQSLSAANLPRTFSELATLILTMITKKLQEPRGRADFIIDQYPEISIKNIERDQRATRSGSV